MELILTLVVVGIVAFLLYKNFGPKPTVKVEESAPAPKAEAPKAEAPKAKAKAPAKKSTAKKAKSK